MMTRVEKLRLKREVRPKKSKQMQEPKTKPKERKERNPYKIVEGKGHISLECWKRLRELKSS